jgi:hypothetical protein
VSGDLTTPSKWGCDNSYVENNKLFKWHKIQELIFGDLKYYSFINKQKSKPKTQNGKQ